MTESETKTDDNIVVELRNVSKRYFLHKQKPFLVHDAVKRIVGHRSGEEFWAVKDISFKLRKGDSVGFIGGNGAGKSTALGLVARTVHATTGEVFVRGRIGALLELGSGFHPDLTGRENIYLNASLLGLSKDLIESRFRKIVNFSGLYDFIDVPLRSYSSGMHVRLGFSVAIHIDPEVLLMDEVFAVGDKSFQKKCIDHVLRFRERGKTILFVSHNPDSVRKLCSRAIWLDHGHVKMDGTSKDVLDAYEAEGK